jgi:hypothetical protein
MTDATEKKPVPSHDPWTDLAEAAQQYERYLELAQLGVLAAQASTQYVPQPPAPDPLTLVWDPK